ncbi:hypothetical protein [Streptomyces griseorubiginosus]|uniref:hypothetical protein n=1 Tax=Streptomyces griseorubiginosus TaxID=67304 RepID=UPI0036E436CC
MDLDRLWRGDLLNAVVALRAAESDAEGWVRLEVTFQDLRQLSADAEALVPASLRSAPRPRRHGRRGLPAVVNLPSPDLLVQPALTA